jgi:hypothetical protein
LQITKNGASVASLRVLLLLPSLILVAMIAEIFLKVGLNTKNYKKINQSFFFFVATETNRNNKTDGNPESFHDKHWCLHMFGY